MFDHHQLNDHPTTAEIQPHLRPDLMRWEHIERLRRRDARKRAAVWQDARRGIMCRAERIAACVGAALLRWAEKRTLRFHMQRGSVEQGS